MVGDMIALMVKLSSQILLKISEIFQRYITEWENLKKGKTCQNIVL